MMNFQGYIYYSQKSLYYWIIFPIAQAKRGFKEIYNFLGHILWSELMEGKTVEGELANIVIFILFCLLSLLLYYAKDSGRILLVVSIILWYIDSSLAKQQYLQTQDKLPTSLSFISEDDLQWQITLPNREIIRSELNRFKIKNISITPRAVYGGAFQEKVGQVWQLEIYLYDRTNLVIHEEKTPLAAVQQGSILAKKLSVPVIFAGSEGIGDYAEVPLDLSSIKVEKVRDRAIKVQKKLGKWHIYTKWQLANSGRFLKKVIKESGFLLFLILMTKLMVEFGAILYYLLLAFMGNKPDTLYYSGIGNSLTLDFDVMDAIEIAIALIVMFVQGWRISREKHLYINSQTFTFLINNQKQGQLFTQNIEAALFLPIPEPEILILARDRALTLADWQQEDELKVMLQAISEGIQECQKTKD